MGYRINTLRSVERSLTLVCLLGILSLQLRTPETEICDDTNMAGCSQTNVQGNKQENSLEAALKNIRLNEEGTVQPDEYISQLATLLRGDLSQAEDVTGSSSAAAVNLGMVMVKHNTDGDDYQLRSKFMRGASHTLTALLRFSGNSPINFIIVTEPESSSWAGQLLTWVVSKRLTMDCIQTRWFEWRKSGRLPPLQFHLVDGETIRNKNPDFFSELVKEIPPNDKAALYFSLFPLYHLSFSSLERLIHIDVRGLDFYTDIAELNQEFSRFQESNSSSTSSTSSTSITSSTSSESTSRCVMGLGLNLSPRYHHLLSGYRETHPQTDLGKPGKLQGLNTGVVLLNLKSMRGSQEYNSLLNSHSIQQLKAKYGFPYEQPGQDFITAVSFSSNHLVHVLPCTFNRQTSLQYLLGPYDLSFDLYHNCEKHVKVSNRNGCGPTPRSCGTILPPNSKHGTDQFLFLEINIKTFWKMMESVTTKDWSWTWFRDPTMDI